MKSFFLSILISLFISKIFDFLQNKTGNFSFIGNPIFGKHYFHLPSNIRGISLYLSMLIVTLFRDYYNNGGNYSFSITIFWLTLPVFLVDLLKDMKWKISTNLQFMGIIFSSLLFIYYSNISIQKIDMQGFDILFHLPLIGLLLTCLFISGLTRTYILLDKLNSLSAINAIMTILSIAYISHMCKDPQLFMSSIIFLGLLIGFFLANYSKGIMAFGNAGSYLVGFFIAIFSICLVERNIAISPWLAVVLNLIPICEVLVYIWRRRQSQELEYYPSDHTQLYGPIFQNLIRRHGSNSSPNELLNPPLKSPKIFIFFLTSIPAIFSVFFWDNKFILITLGLIFCFGCLFLSRKQVLNFDSR